MTKQEKYKIGYYNIHAKLVKKNGNALYCSNVKCTYKSPKRYEWALKKGREYSTDIKDYIPLCPSCHRKYDETDSRREKLREINIGNQNSVSAIRGVNLETLEILDFKSLKEASIFTGILRTAISNNLIGLSNSAGGLKWSYLPTPPKQ